jgi:hypothetical protein
MISERRIDSVLLDHDSFWIPSSTWPWVAATKCHALKWDNPGKCKQLWSLCSVFLLLSVNSGSGNGSASAWCIYA